MQKQISLKQHHQTIPLCCQNHKAQLLCFNPICQYKPFICDCKQKCVCENDHFECDKMNLTYFIKIFQDNVTANISSIKETCKNLQNLFLENIEKFNQAYLKFKLWRNQFGLSQQEQMLYRMIKSAKFDSITSNDIYTTKLSLKIQPQIKVNQESINKIIKTCGQNIQQSSNLLDSIYKYFEVSKKNQLKIKSVQDFRLMELHEKMNKKINNNNGYTTSLSSIDNNMQVYAKVQKIMDGGTTQQVVQKMDKQEQQNGNSIHIKLNRIQQQIQQITQFLHKIQKEIIKFKFMENDIIIKKLQKDFQNLQNFILQATHNQLQIKSTQVLPTQNYQSPKNNQNTSDYLRFGIKNQTLGKMNKVIHQLKQLQKKPKLNLDSHIVQDLKNIQQFFSKRIKSSKLLYRASQHNYSAKKFHELCDNIQNTLILVNTEFHDIIGGFTSLKWCLNMNKNSNSNTETFIFSISDRHKIKLKQVDYSILNGPIFSGELLICDECRFCQLNIQNYIGMKLNSRDNRNNLLKTQGQGEQRMQEGKILKVKIVQWEVFQLQFN